MGAFTTFKSSSVGESGDILEIPSTFLKDPFAKFCRQYSFSSDSGFVTKSNSRTSMKSIQVSLKDIPQVDRFVEQSKSIRNSSEIDTFYSWEERNSSVSTKEKPFITEMGSLSAHALVSAFKCRYQQSSRINAPSEVALDSITHESLTLQRSSFIHDLLLSHFGVISTRFYWHQKEGESLLKGAFVWCGDPLDVLAFNSTHGSLSSLLESHLYSATSFRRLDWLASRSLLGCDLGDTDGYHGNVWSALKQGLSEWLRVYATTLERAVFAGRRRQQRGGAELLELTQCLQLMMRNMLAVAHAFGVSPVSLRDNTEEIQVQHLSGVRLLAWFGRQVITSSPNTSRSLEFIFHRAVTPFIRFLHLWTTVGVIDDPHNEFSIAFNYRFLHRKDANFWRYAVHYQSSEQSAGECLTLRKESSKQNGALFGLVPYSTEAMILRCGLSVHLIRSIAPNVSLSCTQLLAQSFRPLSILFSLIMSILKGWFNVGRW
ncbi:unnamed protein product [Rodentolepis nana]|uniref:Gamma-tubulin complex component n=1 Tax=Rodentolepis nana TaxID=102285 RepID=A0A0R3TAJ4_RODNA|nr:unnamed protein product [Rodentolepis nana]